MAWVKGQSDATIGVNSPLTPQKKISVFTTGEAKNFFDDIFRIPLGFGPDVPDQTDGERRFRLIGLLNPDY